MNNFYEDVDEVGESSNCELKILIREEGQNQIDPIEMETTYIHESDRTVELEDSLIAWQDKYDRLHESHKRVQKVNQTLEDKLLKLVDQNTGERAQLTGDVATLSVRLAQANYNIATLQREIERYKADMSLAIQLLQCKPESFVAQKVTSLPQDVQTKVSQYMRLDTNSHSDSEGSTSGVGIATTTSYHALPASDSPVSNCPFRSSSSLYPMRGNDLIIGNDLTNNSNDQMISAAAMAKYLDDKLKASERKHCETCTCANRDLTVLADTHSTYSKGTQTMLRQHDPDATNLLCLRCSSNLNSPSRTNSPFLIKMVKSSDSVISETKSSVSGIDSNDKLFNMNKKDDLVVNPILGHHRLCDRKALGGGNGGVGIGGVGINGSKLIDLGSNSTSSMLAENINQGKLKSPIQEQTHQQQHNNQERDISMKQSHASNVDIKSSSLRNSKAMAGSSNSMSSRASSQTDGARLFENFNRNLIKSIKADNPKISGPRLCALRIQNGSSNVLLDNIESESCPILYTQRSRLLDEELNEDKEVITSQSESGIQQENNIKISMLMSDGVECNTDVTYAQVNKITTTATATAAIPATTAVVSTRTISTMEDKGYADITTDYHGLDAKSIGHHILTHTALIRTSQINNQSSNKSNLTSSYSDIRESQGQLDKYESVSNRYGIDADEDLSHGQSPTFMSPDLDINDTVTLRRQQLSRVAQWIQNNQVMDNTRFNSSTEALSIDSGYKTKVTNSGNSALIDRDTTNSQRSVNNNISISNDTILIVPMKSGNIYDCEQDQQNQPEDGTLFDVRNMSSSTVCRNQYAQSNINNNVADDDDRSSSSAHVDLAQMEYNVKQFLLKQNEWASNHQYSDTNVNATNSLLNGLSDNDVSPTTRVTNRTTHRTETNL